ncbi:lateral signaling target protein 2 homolog isoform X2 [Penaeus japonicus]|uniref:lateral signaling target protein 2 homolog isoform X2 n=1 Tax=Penaeus japonicus TaxID=27405 RepID=UPI001C70E9BE|nr:lateral signaling target protein 2 homolog isoform X2 [Penaeus japonicus]
MNSLRKWFYRPRKDDPSLMAQFYYADDELNMIAAELDSFDGRKDPERCTALVNQLRQCQDRVLNICVEMMDEVIPNERASRDFRVKFPDDVMQENLAGQLWFGAECLAAGSSIMNREAESSRMRPLAKAVTKTIETVRNLLREQCLKPMPEYTEKIRESLKIFDRLFAEFELSYVSAMVPVKSVEEHDVQQNVVVLFSETVQRALRLGLATQDQIDDYDPALMFTIPRLAIVAGLVMFPDGPLNLDREPRNLSELFRPFRTLLTKIRELLWTMSAGELAALEKALCSIDEPDTSLPQVSEEAFPSSAYGQAAFTSEFVQKFYANYPSCKYLTPELSSLYQPGKKMERCERKRERTSGKSSGSRSKMRQERQSEKFLARLNPTAEERPRARRRSRRSHHHRHHHNPAPLPPPDSDSGEEHQTHHRRHTRTLTHHAHSQIPQPPPPPYDQHHQPRPDQHHTPHQPQRHQRSRRSRHQPVTHIKTIACSCGTVSQYESSYYEAQDPHHHHDTNYVYLQAQALNEGEPNIVQEEVKDASTICDSSRGTDQPEGTWSEGGYVCHSFGTQPSSQEREVKDTEELTNATANMSVQDISESSRIDCTMCGMSQSCSCDNQNVNSSDRQIDLDDMRGELPTVSECDAQQSVLNQSNPPSSTSHKLETETEEGLHVTELASEDCVPASDSVGVEHDQIDAHVPDTSSCSVPEDAASPKSGACSSGSTSPYNSGAEDDEEVALALQAAEVAATWRARARFSDSQDLIHRLFVCISGVADQLQTNYASDLRKILKCVFLMNQSPLEEPPKSEHGDQPEWSVGGQDQDHSTEDSNGGNDSERLSVESAEDALVVIGSPERCDDSTGEPPDTQPLEDSPPTSPPSSPLAIPPSMSFAPVSPTTPSPPLSSSGTVIQPPHVSSADITDSHSSSILASSPPVCPPSVQVPAAIFNDHALLQFSEATIPPNVDLLSSPQVHYTESFGLIPEPFPRSQQEQPATVRENIDGAPLSSPAERGNDSGRRRPRVQEPPAWVPDQQAPRCMACGAAFTMVRRRHHCRNCGKVFCAQCSQHAVPLPHYGIWKAVRVCNVCFLYYVTFSTETPTPAS